MANIKSQMKRIKTNAVRTERNKSNKAELRTWIRKFRAEVEAGRVGLDPWDASMIQPSSVDVRLDKFFRLFDNHKYPVIDPAADQRIAVTFMNAVHRLMPPCRSGNPAAEPVK